MEEVVRGTCRRLTISTSHGGGHMWLLKFSWKELYHSVLIYTPLGLFYGTLAARRMILQLNGKLKSLYACLLSNLTTFEHSAILELMLLLSLACKVQDAPVWDRMDFLACRYLLAFLPAYVFVAFFAVCSATLLFLNVLRWSWPLTLFLLPHHGRKPSLLCCGPIATSSQWIDVPFSPVKEGEIAEICLHWKA